ncbi:MAG: fused MFS/spermidine synthase [Gammaproteobacteria bacterium]|nr:fused MFS/spermidine synthase [Gammaproteobacteria bacterium]
MRTENAVRLLLPLFFVSGATALAYQVLWMRELQLVFGTSTFAVSTLLAGFMAGLAAGGFAIARFADRLPRPLIAYGILELGIGLYALVLPTLLALLTPVYLDLWRALQPGPLVFGVIQFALVSALLLPPTAAMGATLPLLARFATLRLGTAGDRVGTLYAINTCGAVLGIALCGFLLLPQVGMFHTTMIAAAANLLLGTAAVALGRWVSPGDVAAEDRTQTPAGQTPLMIVVCVAIGLAGFAVLVYEVSWTRLLTLLLGSSAYTFAVMLIAFLLGIALGGKLGGQIADRMLLAGGRSQVLRSFAVVEIGIAMLAYVTMYLYPQLPFWYVHLFDQFGAAQRFAAVWWVSLLLAGLVMTPPAILMGMHFPIAVRAVVGMRKNLGRPVGIVYGVNAIGAAVGAFLAGFVLLPTLGMQGTVLVGAAAGLVAAGVLALYAAGRSKRYWALVSPLALAGMTVLFVTQRPPWNPLLMTSGMYHYVSNLEDHSREEILRYSVDLYELLFYEEGLSSVVTVAQNIGTSHRWLAINGKVDASTTDDMPTQVLLALLPMQFVERAEDVMVIGLASGVTAGAVALVPELRRLEIVELEPAIGRAARYFDAWNHAVLSDPRVELVFNDARNQLLLAAPGSFDAIVSEPSNPWISGIANLFTREFLELGKSRLRQGGAWSQWVPIYGLDSADLRSILGTFSAVFRYVLVYASIEYNDLVLIGSDTPLQASETAAMRLLSQPAIALELDRIDIRSVVDMLALYQMDAGNIASMDAGSPINTDDNMLIEYSSARKLHVDTRGENFALLLQYAGLPEAEFSNAGQWAQLAAHYRRRGDAARATAAASRAAAAAE